MNTEPEETTVGASSSSDQLAGTDTIDKGAWVERFAARMLKESEMPMEEGRKWAEVALENLDGDLSESPEDAADDEMSCWE